VHAVLQAESSGVGASGGGADAGVDTDARWVRNDAESEALVKLRGVLDESCHRSNDAMSSLARSVGGEARCFLRYLRLHSVSQSGAHA
jgi:hypothetical protein